MSSSKAARCWQKAGAPVAALQAIQQTCSEDLCCRHAALDQLLHRFVDAGPPDMPKQILALGAGFDTTWFRLKSQGKQPTKYFEVDFADVTRHKCSILSSKAELRDLLPTSAGSVVDAAAGKIITDSYCLLPVDLRNLKGFEASLLEANFDPQLPTYVLSECVLVYMEPAASTALVQFLGSLLPTAAFAVYEQINPDDAFGRQMVSNLESRGCPLKGLRSTPTLEAHRQRFLTAGWQYAEANALDTIYRNYLDPADKQRIERLEMFDEFEEWHMMQEHYCIVVARNDGLGILQSVGFEHD